MHHRQSERYYLMSFVDVLLVIAAIAALAAIVISVAVFRADRRNRDKGDQS